jgi:hypothetical protein
MLDFSEDMLWQICDIFPLIHLGFFKGDRDNFLIQFVVVGHGENADRVAFNKAHGLELFSAQDEDIEGVAVFGVGAGDEALVGWIMGGGVQNPVQPEHAGRFVHLIFLLAAFGDFNDCNEFFGLDPGIGDIVPDIHIFSSLLSKLSVISIPESGCLDLSAHYLGQRM